MEEVSQPETSLTSPLEEKKSSSDAVDEEVEESVVEKEPATPEVAPTVQEEVSGEVENDDGTEKNEADPTEPIDDTSEGCEKVEKDKEEEGDKIQPGELHVESDCGTPEPLTEDAASEVPEKTQEEAEADDKEEVKDDSEAKADSSGADADETVFEEVDANVSAEKQTEADESDMLGQSDMTVPEKEDETDAVTEAEPSPMEVDNLSTEDVEMASVEENELLNEESEEKPPEEAAGSKLAESAADPEKATAEADDDLEAMEVEPEVADADPKATETEAEKKSTEAEKKSSEAEADVTQTESEIGETDAEPSRGEDVVDEGSENAATEESTEKADNTPTEDSVTEEAVEKDVTSPAQMDTSEINEEEKDKEKEDAEETSPVSEKTPKDSSVTEDLDASAADTTRDEDANPEVENVQEPEESDVCLIPDTDTEMTDAEKERAIKARENAEKESELVEQAATEKEPASEEAPQEPLLEELLPSEPPTDGAAPAKTIIFLAVSAKHKCIQCHEDKICGYRYKEADKPTTEYVCEMPCVDNLLEANPGKFFLRRKKFLVDEVPESDVAEHNCLECKNDKPKCKYFFKQDEETFYICSEDCYKELSNKEPEKFNLKRDSIRVRNIGHTTISAKGISKPDSRIISRSAAEAEAARLERTTSFLRNCAECSLEIQIRPNGKNLVWQTMDFCDELCLGKYQRKIGSHCQTCQGEVPHQSLGKYCVRFGFEIRQFCCATCLNNYKKGLKTCSCCQKDISTSGEGFLAPVGDKEQFKDFCSQACMRRYDSMCNAKKKLRTDRCAVCNFEKPMRVEMSIDGKEQSFCSNPCFSAFKFVSNIVPDQCGMCSKYFERKCAESYTIYGDKQRPKVFCSRICFNVFIIVTRQITSCQWCKVKKYDFDMIMKVTDQRQIMMCSLNCLTLYGVSINAFSRAAIKCDNCLNCTTPQYHLTMSDASMRNFCTYQCVMQFQGQFARVPLTLDSEAVAAATHHVSPKQQQTTTNNSSTATPFPTGLPKRVKLNPNASKTTMMTTTSAGPSNQNVQAQRTVLPVISNVASLAPLVVPSEARIPVTQVRRGGQRGRGRGRKFVSEVRTAQIITPPFSAEQPATRNRSATTSPVPPAATTSPATIGKTRVGRLLTKQTATETARPPSPIIQKEYETKIITVPPYPPMVRNVMTNCHPITEDASVDCRVETCEIGIQTDEDISSKILIPVPVPIFIPQPMYMYSLPFPVPVPFPLPIPVPIFIPTTRNSANGILKEIKKIQDKMPADPFEAELLMMAEMVADEKNESDSDSEEDTKPEPRMMPVEYQAPVVPTNNVVNIEPQNNSSFGEDVLQMALKMASGDYEEPGVDLEATMQTNTITNPPPGMVQTSPDDTAMHMSHHIMMEQQPQRGARGRKRGAIASPATPRTNRSPIKRQRLSTDNAPPQTIMPVEKPDANMCLKFTFGVNAWKQWVMTKNADIEKSSIRRRLFKTELLQMTADELNYSLCLFVKEVRKPNGTEYAPDTIYYLVLGIQQYLYENGRIDNIFTDPYYERFTDCLDEVARRFSVLYNDSQYIVTRVEEEHLWECKQLGAHSPHVLLSTLMFFNTKHFNLTTVEEHMQLSFSHIMKHWKRSAQNTKSPGTRNVLLRFYPPQAGLDANPRKKKVYEQQENEENPLRCPVRLYEFYLSKCPESVKTRNDVFYLQPERSCVPDSPVWYSTQALGQDALQKMLHRVKMVKEINIALLTS